MCYYSRQRFHQFLSSIEPVLDRMMEREQRRNFLAHCPFEDHYAWFVNEVRQIARRQYGVSI